MKNRDGNNMIMNSVWNQIRSPRIKTVGRWAFILTGVFIIWRLRKR